jgi:hypothetical protein
VDTSTITYTKDYSDAEDPTNAAAPPVEIID